MGIYLNPGNMGFRESVSSEIYIDKSELIAFTNRVLGTEQKNLCVSRPRRFGKSMAAKMLAAYYSRGCDSDELFCKLKIADATSYRVYLNQYPVIFLNMQSFLSETHDIERMTERISSHVGREIKKAYPDVDYYEESGLSEILDQIFAEKEEQFVFIIDEWDCVFREKKDHKEDQAKYLDFLRSLLKDKSYVALAYMTGILPIKKYGSHSALNMFEEYSMIDQGRLSEFTGFTEEEVKQLCVRYQMDFQEIKRWYDGYHMSGWEHIYNPRSVVAAMLSGKISNYWTKTETYEALKRYIDMDFDGLRQSVLVLLSGDGIKVNTQTFQNDMTSFSCRDDILTLLIHLGYLGYDERKQQVFIPNYEVSEEFVNALQGEGWGKVADAVKASDDLIRATWRKDTAAVEQAMEEAHFETSVLTYNNENSLACAISLAYYSARIYYTSIRELPAGKGFADIVFVPRLNHADKPAMVVELKWDKSAEGAIQQIKQKNYIRGLEEYQGSILLVGINYNKKLKKHECMIEEVHI